MKLTRTYKKDIQINHKKFWWVFCSVLQIKFVGNADFGHIFNCLLFLNEYIYRKELVNKENDESWQLLLTVTRGLAVNSL